MRVQRLGLAAEREQQSRLKSNQEQGELESIGETISWKETVCRLTSAENQRNSTDWCTCVFETRPIVEVCMES